MKRGLKKAKIIQMAFMVVILAVLIVANVVLGIFSEAITTYLGGFGTNFSELNYQQGNQICQDITAEGVVLLRNENNALPLNASVANKKKVSVFGWGATDGGFMTSGAGSGSSADRGAGKLVTFLEALEGKEAQVEKDKDGNEKELMPVVEGAFEYYKPLIEMYKTYKSERDSDNYWSAAYPFFNLIEPSVEKVQTHLSGAMEWSDTAIVVISRVGGEGQDMPRIQKKVNPDINNPSKNNTIEDTDRTYLQLSTEEEEMLSLVRNSFEKLIVIINACNAMDLSFLEKYDVDAALSVGGTGQSGTVAVAKILTGEITPSGKTVDTYAYDHTTAATYANGPDCRTANGSSGGERTYTNSTSEFYIDYAEGIYVGYKWYETADTEKFWESDYAKSIWKKPNSTEPIENYEDVVQYPFGFGLSYTNFEWKIESVSPKAGTAITAETDITIKVRVSNTGSVKGQDVVQVYYNPPYYAGEIEKSSVNLIAFAKTEVLNPAGEEGDSQILTITFKAEDMKSFDYDDSNSNGFSGYELEAGDYEITLRTDAHTISSASGAAFEYSVTNGIKLEKDSVTQTTVSNIFTGDKDGDVSIDGTTTEANIVYLERLAFTTTFPTPQERRTKSSAIPANGWKSTFKETTQMPITGEDSGLRLYNDDGSVNKELILELGADFYSATWDVLLDQITVKELNDLVMGGGYRTKAIPSLNKPDHTDLDGPSGLNQENMTSGNVSSEWTSFPVETVMAQSWNAKLSYIYGLAIGNEAYSTGIAGWYAPAVNIHRSPFDGRNFEYYSEDPYLSGVMGAETVRGATNTGLYCYVKHFAVNETEYNRQGLYTWLTEQALREIYLKPFEICVKDGKANAIMSSFNRLGATWTGGNYKLLTTVLRDEWGFKGSVITDYADLNLGGYMNIDQGIRAGNDFWLDGTRTGTLNGYTDRTSATAVACAREAAKNIIYTYCNTVYRQDLFANGALDDEDAAKYATEVGSKASSQAAAGWKYWGWLPLDIVGFGGLAVGIYFCFFHKALLKKKENGELKNS